MSLVRFRTTVLSSFGLGSAWVTETSGGSFITGGGNIYSFSVATEFATTLSGAEPVVEGTRTIVRVSRLSQPFLRTTALFRRSMEHSTNRSARLCYMTSRLVVWEATIRRGSSCGPCPTATTMSFPRAFPANDGSRTSTRMPRRIVLAMSTRAGTKRPSQ